MIDFKKVIPNMGKERNEYVKICEDENSQSTDENSQTSELFIKSTNNIEQLQALKQK